MSSARDGLVAIGLMVLAMAAFALTDVFIKFSAETLSNAQILLVMGLGAAVVFAALALRAGDALITRHILAPGVIGRNLSEALGTFCIVAALALAPLSVVASINQAVPLIVTLGAATILGERVGPRRWFAVIVGLIGVLIILRPATEGLSTGALFAVGSAIGLAGRDVFTRRVPPQVTTLQLATWGSLVLVIVGGAMILGGAAVKWPDAWEAAMLAGAVVSAIIAYYAITASVRLGEVSLVSPFRYTRLVFALILGVTIFGERPDAATLIGAAIVIASGLYVFSRERQLARRALSETAKPG